ncbi:hypothetical protein ASG31_07755 [Chryseobacterium sp. Leaf404]|nr:hypothetical protein ASG31_07755 [Chryseobacterium sp. Leaf404]
MLTEKFKKKSVISKSLWLLNLVLANFPVVIKRIFTPQSYARPLQTFYLFLIFLLISLFLVITLVAAVDVIRSIPLIQNIFLTLDKNTYHLYSQYAIK